MIIFIFIFQKMDEKGKQPGLLYPSNDKTIHKENQSYLCPHCHTTFSSESSCKGHIKSCPLKKCNQ